MKKVFLVLTLVAITSAFVACGSAKKADKTQRVGGRNDASPAGKPGGNSPIPSTTQQAAGNLIWGQIIPQGATIQDRNSPIPYNAHDVVRVFLGTDWPWSVIGSTTPNLQDPGYNSQTYNPNPGCKTNVNCAAGLTLGQNNNGTHQPLQFANGQTIDQVTSSGQQISVVGGGITMAFWDSLTGEKSVADEGGNTHTIDPIPVWIPLVPDNKSYVKGTTVKLYFQDSKGSLVLDGTINGTVINGTIRFDNLLDFNDSQNYPASGALGQFSISKCSAFRCQ